VGYWEESESLGQPKTNKERERKKEQSWCVQRTTRKIGAGVVRAHFHQCVVIVRTRPFGSLDLSVAIGLDMVPEEDSKSMRVVKR